MTFSEMRLPDFLGATREASQMLQYSILLREKGREEGIFDVAENIGEKKEEEEKKRYMN